MSAAAALPLETLFSVANTTALLSWVLLLVLPRTRLLRGTLLGMAVGGFCLLYTVLIQLFFFGAPGGFFSLAGVQQLFTSPAVALAGWVHYLAFDLFVGVWVARRADLMGLSRWLQAPVLMSIFMFGPIGLLLFACVWGVRQGTGGAHASIAGVPT